MKIIKADLFKNLAKFFLLSFFILFPFQVRSLIFNVTPFEGGNFNDFTSFFVYAADICLLLSLLSFGIVSFFTSKKTEFFEPELKFWSLVFLLSLFASLIFSKNLILSVFLLIRILEIFVLVILLNSKILSDLELTTVLFLGLGVQIIIMFSQLVLQHNIGLRFLGEPNLDVNLPGVAKLVFGEFKFMRPYGTLLHPNILGGFLLFNILYMVFFTKINYKKEILAILSFLLILTFSRSAILGLIAAFVYFYFKDLPKYRYALLIVVIISLLLMLGHGLADEERVIYAGIAILMMITNPLGVGLSGFTLNMQSYTPIKLMPWDLQPVHNVFLLLGSEAGIISLIIFLCLFYFIFDKNSSREVRAMLVALFVVAMLDHYFYTSYQGQILLALYLFVATRSLKKSA